jgi:replicative DNA helicase
LRIATPSDITLERPVPHNLDAERAILGACLLDENGIWAATEQVEPGDFYHEGHRIIFERMTELASSGKAVDLVTLRAELRRRDEEEKAGGPAYLADLTSGLPRALNIRHYASLLKETASARQLIHLCHDTMNRAYLGEDKSAELLEEHESGLFRIASRSLGGTGFETADAMVTRVYREIEDLCSNKADVPGISTGFAELDRMTAGLHPGELVIVAGRPGLGKTSLCSTIALHAARRRKSVGILSLEMTKEELTKRHISNEAEVDYHKIRTGYLGREDWAKIGRVSQQMAGWKLHIDDSGDVSMLQLRARAQRLALEKGLDLLIVDYLQLLRGSGKRYDNRTHEVTDISRALKSLAKELRIPIIAAAQLNRESDRANRRPRMSDIRESGAVEQDADLMLALHREGPDDESQYAPVEVGIVKQRNGATGTFKLSFIRQFMKFSNLWSEE